jgi:hypothetical protein
MMLVDKTKSISLSQPIHLASASHFEKRLDFQIRFSIRCWMGVPEWQNDLDDHHVHFVLSFRQL